MTLRRDAAKALAQAFLAGPWHLRNLLARGSVALDAGDAWLRDVAFAVMTTYPEPPLHRLEALATFVLQHPSFVEAWRLRRIPRAAPHFLPFEPQMGPHRWDVPEFTSPSDVARWLGLDVAQLEWFSDLRGLQRSADDGPLQHYRFQWIARGPHVPRLLEAPKARLKAIQRQLLRELLSRVPAHAAAHGFVRGRSVVTHAALHVRQPVVVRFDLAHFFTSVTAPRAHGLFASLGYPMEVARSLLGLCTTRTPEAILRAAPYPTPFTATSSASRFALLRQLDEWHLPQGAPTSPALANLAAFGLDVRLQAFADQHGLRYSRYADDLAFSGDVKVRLLCDAVRAVVRDEGFRLNERKTRILRARARQELAGVVVNQHPNLDRTTYDALKALLHRCRRDGPASQGADVAQLRAHLAGKISWARMISPSRGLKLQRTFEQIAW